MRARLWVSVYCAFLVLFSLSQIQRLCLIWMKKKYRCMHCMRTWNEKHRGVCQQLLFVTVIGSEINTHTHSYYIYIKSERQNVHNMHIYTLRLDIGIRLNHNLHELWLKLAFFNLLARQILAIIENPYVCALCVRASMRTYKCCQTILF